MRSPAPVPRAKATYLIFSRENDRPRQYLCGIHARRSTVVVSDDGASSGEGAGHLAVNSGVAGKREDIDDHQGASSIDGDGGGNGRRTTGLGDGRPARPAVRAAALRPGAR